MLSLSFFSSSAVGYSLKCQIVTTRVLERRDGQALITEIILCFQTANKLEHIHDQGGGISE